MFRRVTLLDGGMGQELYRRSGKPASRLWSAQVMLDSPEMVTGLHCEFIAAGAEIITLNAYIATPERLGRDADAALFLPLQKAAIDTAHAARARSGKVVRIAGSLPPLVASYHASSVPSAAQCEASYRRIVEAQADGVDLFIGETFTTTREGAIVARVAGETGKPVWVSFTVSDTDGTLLRSGERLEAAVETAMASGAEAVLVNCSMPEAIDRSIGVLAASGTRFGAYANGFKSVASLAPGGTVQDMEARSDLGPHEYADHALGWAARGASIVGGCCEVGPAHIAEIRRRIDELDASTGGR